MGVNSCLGSLRFGALGFFGLALLPSCRCEPEPSAPSAAPLASATPSPPASVAAAAPPPPTGLEATVHLPPSLASGKKAPLLIMLHGLGSSGEDIQASDWPSFASSHGVAWMAPSGPKDSKGRRFWNAGAS